jgi:hypothetical protein
MNQAPQRRVAILQSCYVPWKGYFDIIGSVDVFIVYDDVQYAKAHWHNRNQILTSSGPRWMTIPVLTRGDRFQPIDEVKVSQPFAEKHWRSLEHNYGRAAHWGAHRDWLRDLYDRAGAMTGLSEINLMFMRAISRQLGFETEFILSRELGVGGGQTERLIKLCHAVGGTSYLSGPSAAAYIEAAQFEAAGVALEWMRYDGYRPYNQLFAPFTHAVSILDLMLNEGPAARSYMKAPVLGPSTGSGTSP